MGRALDRLFNADRASLMTSIVVRAMEEFHVQLDQCHNDSTSITFSGRYAQAVGRTICSQKAVSITYGYNKDHRPDLKQLLWILTVSADGSVPVHYRLCDGNTSDDPTHIQIWEAICKLTGRTDFLYGTDCKRCARANLDHIAHQKGRFIIVLPGNRKEDAWFRNHIQDHDLPWEEAHAGAAPTRAPTVAFQNFDAVGLRVYDSRGSIASLALRPGHRSVYA